MANGQTSRTSRRDLLPLSLSFILSSFSKELFIQTTVQYLRKKAPQLLHPITAKDENNYKTIANVETINILLSVLQLALPSISNADLIQEIQTMSGTAKVLTRSTEPFVNALPHHFTPSPTTQLRSLTSKENNCCPWRTECEERRKERERRRGRKRKRKTAIRRAVDHCKTRLFVKIVR